MKKHVVTPAGAEEFEEDYEEISPGMDHHEILVHSWAGEDTVDVDTPVFDDEGRYRAMPLGTTSSLDSNLIKIHVHGSTPPISAFAVFYVEMEGGGHEAANHDPHRPLGTFAPPGIPAGHPSGRIFTVVPYRPNLKMNYHASEFGGIGRIRVVAIDTPFSAPTPPASLAAQYARRQTLIADIDERIADGRGFEVSSLDIKVQVPDLELLPDVSEYAKVGGTPEHHGPPSSSEDNNHWGTSDINSLVQTIASNFDASIGIIRVNDMSLGADGEGFGGRFDLGGTWGAATSHSPHFGHSNGRAADIGYRIATASGDPANRKADVWDALDNSGLTQTFPSTATGVDPDKFFDEPALVHFHVMK